MEKNSNYRSDSLYNYFRTQLYNNGLFEDQAEAVLKQTMENSESMRGRWDDPIGHYPQALIIATWLIIQDEAVKWIDANAPQHWARAMFVAEEGLSRDEGQNQTVAGIKPTGPV
jgi:hypothetical protein